MVLSAKPVGRVPVLKTTASPLAKTCEAWVITSVAKSAVAAVEAEIFRSAVMLRVPDSVKLPANPVEGVAFAVYWSVATVQLVSALAAILAAVTVPFRPL